MSPKDPRSIVLCPVVTEASINLIEAENKLVFIVDLKASKRSIKHAIEELYDVKVENVNTLITARAEKKAYVKLTPDFKASDLAVKLGIS